MFGYIGKILIVDLTTGKTDEKTLDPELLSKYIGGRGLTTKILYDELKPGIDALSEENIMVFMTGPLTGLACSSGRFCIASKSPLTGTIFDSQVGGTFGVELKKGGYDGIIILGKSKKPVYLMINDGKAELKDAKNLWGKNTGECTDLILNKEGKNVKVSCIGPAGEHLVRYACIITEKERAAGRGGLGAVMGSKNLKAVAVRGTGKIIPANEYAFRNEDRKFMKLLRGHPVTGDGFGRFGTLILMNPVNKQGVLPVNNFQEGYSESIEKLTGETMQKYLVKKRSCALCPIACGRIIKVGNTTTSGPEFESTWALGVLTGYSSAESVAHLNELCNQYGLDTISTGNTMGFIKECLSKCLIDEKISFDNHEALANLITKIAFREGIGDLIAEGTKRISSKIGGKEFAINVKGLELPAYDPRGTKGQGLAYITSNRGGCHTRAYMIPQEVLSMPSYLDNLETDGKAKKVIDIENIFTVLDSLMICKFTTLAVFKTFDYEVEVYSRLLTTATGFYFSPEDFKQAGERIWNLERCFNNREGFTKADDSLPKRFSKPMIGGPADGETINTEKMLEDYYDLRGWDSEGMPSERKLKELSLDKIKVREIWPKKIISLNYESIDEAIATAKKKAGIENWIEASSPLIKSQGNNAISQLRSNFPNNTIIADYKTMDTGYLEVTIAAQAGADIITISSHASNNTIVDAVGAAGKYSVKIMIDLFSSNIDRAKELESLGVNYIRVFDEEKIEAISNAVTIPVVSLKTSKYAKLITESYYDEKKAPIKRKNTPENDGIWPKLQVALDLDNLPEALKLAHGAKKAEADWLEAGTPLIKYAGMEAVRKLRIQHPKSTIVADLKTLCYGSKEVAIAARAGADIIGICGASEDKIILDAIQTAKEYNVRIMADLISIKDPVKRAKELEDMGADYIEFHISVDDQMRSSDAKIPFPLVEQVSKVLTIPMGVAGGMRADTAPLAIKSGAKVAVVGGAITRAANPEKASLLLLKAMGRK